MPVPKAPKRKIPNQGNKQGNPSSLKKQKIINQENYNNDETYISEGNNTDDENTDDENADDENAEGNFRPAPTVFHFSPEIPANFEEILQLKKGEAEHIIKYFKNDYEHGIEPVSIPNARVPPDVVLEVHPPESVFPLSDFISRSFLPGVEFDSKSNVWKSKDKTISLTTIGKGSYGKIYQDEDGLVYKETQLRLHISNNLEVVCEDFYRNFLLEAFIQVVLQNENPLAVGKISGIYIDKRINTRKSIRATNSINAILEDQIHPRLPTKEEARAEANKARNASMIYSFFITMDRIDYTFDRYARTFPNKKISLEQAKRIFIILGKNLTNFHSVGFKHGDFHAGNLMFNHKGEPIIIDLGMGCIEFGGHVYSVKKKECQSYDLLMLMASLYQYYKDIFEPNAYKAIGDCMINSDNESVYKIASEMGYTTVFYAFYYDTIHDSELESKIPKRLTNNPDKNDTFENYWENYEPPSIARSIRRCFGLGCGRGTGVISTRRRKSNRRKTRKLRKAPQIR